MEIERVNNNIPYTAPEQQKSSSNSPDIHVETAGVKDKTHTTKIKQDSGSNTKGNSENTKGQENHIKSAVDQANQKIWSKRTRCEFKYYEETNRVAIKVIDRDSDEVIREIPPEETLEMVEKMWELAGLIVDEKR